VLSKQQYFGVLEMEEVYIGLEETVVSVVETSPDFDESPQEPPAKKS